MRYRAIDRRCRRQGVFLCEAEQGNSQVSSRRGTICSKIHQAECTYDMLGAATRPCAMACRSQRRRRSPASDEHLLECLSRPWHARDV
eukprot:2709393-Pleurochrysis_carterae.AAC.2